MRDERKVLLWLAEGSLTRNDAVRLLQVLQPVQVPAAAENAWMSFDGKGGF